MIAPSSPTQRSQPSDTPTSTLDPLAHGRRQHLVAVGRVLRIEALPARERHDAGRDAVRPRGSSAAAMASCSSEPVADEDQLRRARPRPRAGRSRPARRPRVPSRPCRPATGSFCRVSASATGPSRRSIASAQAADGLVRVARPDEPQVRDRPQRGVVLDRLVGRPVLAEPDRVVRPDVDDVEAGQRRQAGPRRACSR